MNGATHEIDRTMDDTKLVVQDNDEPLSEREKSLNEFHDGLEKIQEQTRKNLLGKDKQIKKR